MFHKQNIPESGPSKADIAQSNNNHNTNNTNNDDHNKDEAAMAETNDTQDNAQANSAPFGRPSLGGQSYNNTQPQVQAEGRKLTIGPGITMSGEIENCDQLLVEGTVEATLNGAKMLDIAETGVFYGSVDIEEAVIAGRFEGDLTVDGRVTIETTGTVIGTITYRELTVDAGATIEGKIASFASAGNKTAENSATDFSKLKAASKKTTNKKASAA